MYYVIQVASGKENKTIEDIKIHMKDTSFFDVFTPSRKVVKKVKGQYKEVTERCFPGYVFVQTDDIKKLFFDLYWVPDYTKVLGREGLTYHFVPLNEEESRMVDILYNPDSDRITELSNIEVTEGDRIVVLDGPLLGLMANVVKVNLHKRFVLIELPFLGQQVTAKVGINIISKVGRQ